MSEEVKNQTEGKEVVTVDDNELAELMAESQKLQEKENSGDGIKADYLLLAKPATKAVSRANKDLYIEGLSIGDIFIQKDRLNLGKELKVVPLAFVTLYQEKENDSADAKFFGVWNKEQASKFDLVEGSYFNRQLPNGHILCPVNWVMLNVIGHHEIENAVIAFKSTGSRIWKKWKEDAKGRSGSSATLVYRIFEEAYSNDKFSWTDFGFEYVENLLETDKAEALYSLKKSNKIREDYNNAVLVGNHDLDSLKAPKTTTAYIEDASDVEDASDDDMDEQGF